jgi:hypothetical protein
LIGGKIDLDLLSIFPQNYSRSVRGMGRKGKLFKVNNGAERKMEVPMSNEEDVSLYGPS